MTDSMGIIREYSEEISQLSLCIEDIHNMNVVEAEVLIAVLKLERRLKKLEDHVALHFAPR